MVMLINKYIYIFHILEVYEVSSAPKVSINLIKNILNTVILWNITLKIAIFVNKNVTI